MSAFDIFQTATATMYKLTVDGYGDLSEGTGFSIDIDPDFGRKRVFSKDQEEITGKQTFISPNSNIDLTHDQWRITYNGRDYQVEDLQPIHDIGTNNISHYEVILR